MNDVDESMVSVKVEQPDFSFTSKGTIIDFTTDCTKC